MPVRKISNKGNDITEDTFNDCIVASLDTEPQLEAVTQRVRRFSNELATRTNAYINTCYPLGVSLWVETPDTHGMAKVLSVRPSQRPGWMIIYCNTIRGDIILELSAFWPITLRFQIR